MLFDALRISDFAYDTTSSEYPNTYVPGGFHPVTLGNVISSAKARYHVVHKLGWGGYATVWLVQDLSSLEWYALRIRASDGAHEGEDDVIEHLRSESSSPHLPTIFNLFTIEGPNGRHTAIVTDVIAPLDVVLGRRNSRARVDLKALVRGLVEALAHLHSAGIVHGDLHIRNIGLDMGMRKLEPNPHAPLWCPILDRPNVTVVRVHNPDALELSSHFPPYLVSPIDLGKAYQKLRGVMAPHVVQLCDFGNAHLVGKSYPNGGYMPDISPPEWAVLETRELRSEVVSNTASDVWALGLLIFRVMTGESLIYEYGDRLLEMVKLVGAVPSAWKDHSALKTLSVNDVTPESAHNSWQQHHALLRNVCSCEGDADALVALLRRILVLDPAARPSAEDILCDIWFSLVCKCADGNEVQGTVISSHNIQDNDTDSAHHGFILSKPRLH